MKFSKDMCTMCVLMYSVYNSQYVDILNPVYFGTINSTLASNCLTIVLKRLYHCTKLDVIVAYHVSLLNI